MTQEDKELLLKDLCGRLPYGVIIESLEHPEIMTIKHLAIISVMSAEPYKPYLRPMSSMTEEELDTYRTLKWTKLEHEVVDWLNTNKFDYRGLIPKGLAIEVTKENNPYEEINL